MFACRLRRALASVVRSFQRGGGATYLAQANKAGMLQDMLSLESTDPAKFLSGFVKYCEAEPSKPGRRAADEATHSNRFDFAALLQSRRVLSGSAGWPAAKL